MTTLAQAEQALVNAIKASAIAEKVALVAGASQGLGGGLTKHQPVPFPCIIAMFDGGKSISTAHTPRIHSRWRVFVGVNYLEEEASRKGGKGMAGAQEMLACLVVLLHARTLEGAGTLSFEGVENLTSEASIGQGYALYAADFTLPITLSAPSEAELATFTTFTTLSATWPLAEASEQTPRAVDTITTQREETR